LNGNLKSERPLDHTQTLSVRKNIILFNWFKKT